MGRLNIKKKPRENEPNERRINETVEQLSASESEEFQFNDDHSARIKQKTHLDKVQNKTIKKAKKGAKSLSKVSLKF